MVLLLPFSPLLRGVVFVCEELVASQLLFLVFIFCLLCRVFVPMVRSLGLTYNSSVFISLYLSLPHSFLPSISFTFYGVHSTHTHWCLRVCTAIVVLVSDALGSRWPAIFGTFAVLYAACLTGPMFFYLCICLLINGVDEDPISLLHIGELIHKHFQDGWGKLNQALMDVIVNRIHSARLSKETGAHHPLLLRHVQSPREERVINDAANRKTPDTEAAEKLG
nr:hypothetical protein Iba_chr01bCG9140 [Ipomoea batatas]